MKHSLCGGRRQRSGEDACGRVIWRPVHVLALNSERVSLLVSLLLLIFSQVRPRFPTGTMKFTPSINRRLSISSSNISKQWTRDLTEGETQVSAPTILPCVLQLSTVSGGRWYYSVARNRTAVSWTVLLTLVIQLNCGGDAMWSNHPTPCFNFFASIINQAHQLHYDPEFSLTELCFHRNYYWSRIEPPYTRVFVLKPNGFRQTLGAAMDS